MQNMKILLFPLLAMILFVSTMTFASAQSNSTTNSSNDTLQSDSFSVKFASTIGSGAAHLNFPQGIAADNSGNIYVTDSNNNRIVKFDSKGNLLETIGSTGSGNGQLLFPVGVTVDKSGNIYVADLDNYRIEKFDSSGNFLLKFSTSIGGNVTDPRGVAVDDSGNIYVADMYNAIEKFDSSGNLISTIGNYEISGTQGITLDKSGNIYALDNGKPQIVEFSSSGTFIKEWGSLCKISTKDWCTDPDGVGPFEIGDGQFYDAIGVAVDDSGNVFVTDPTNSRVEIFDPNGHFFYKFGSGTGNRIIGEANGIAVYNGKIYVVDQLNYQVQVFDITYGNTTSAPNVVSTSPTMYPYTPQDAPGVPKVVQPSSSAPQPALQATQTTTPSTAPQVTQPVTPQATQTTTPSTEPQTTPPITQPIASSMTTTTSVPAFIKNYAKEWSNDAITTSDFSSNIKYMVDQKIITSPQTSTLVSSPNIPTWMKDTAKWWADGEISDSDFVSAVQYLVNQNIIKIKN